ncbi:MAG: class I SAM-dependent methyltransferase [Bryobacterales bacterium]|nr:class I SAM-dependent methyltransferase [Bryobacteraceae bacterium]MDW8130031.1 class I SAM-dependent methyltransferase [Bryobacterales bacterium]
MCELRLAEATPTELARLRELCREAGYDEEGLARAFGLATPAERLERRLPHLLYLTREGKRLDTLVRLFMLGVSVTREETEAALGPELAEACARWGLVQRCGDAVSARVRLTPFRGLLLATDQPQRPEIARRADQVMGITPSTVTLANFTVRRPARNALDLGTGCGVQALLAASHAEQVWATDRNSRALEFARFNACLNNLANICFLQGDRYEPVRGRRFELIAVNPPFAVSPSLRYYYRDSGEPAERFVQGLARMAPEHLEEGGFFQMILDWVERAGQDWRQRLASWFEGSGCDVWAFRLSREPAPLYAYVWLRDTEPADATEADRLYRQWMEYFEQEKVEAVSNGLIAMRRRSARNWARFDEISTEVPPSAGEWVELAFRLSDYLETTSDEELLAARLRLSQDARLIEESQVRQGRWQAESCRIRLCRGLYWEGRVDLRLKDLLARMDGRHELRDLLVHLAVELGAAPGKVITQALPLLRDLILRGFLLPEGFDPPGQPA